MREKRKKRLIIHSNAHRDRMPTAPTQPKRLVSEAQYFITSAIGGFFGLLGFLFFICFCISGCAALFVGLIPFWGDLYQEIFDVSVVLLKLSLGAFCGCMPFFIRARTIEPVAAIIRHNSGQLPEVETLVRASEVPPPHHQAELLRGVAPPTSETPPEELLRATLKGTHESDGRW